MKCTIFWPEFYLIFHLFRLSVQYLSALVIAYYCEYYNRRRYPRLLLCSRLRGCFDHHVFRPKFWVLYPSGSGVCGSCPATNIGPLHGPTPVHCSNSVPSYRPTFISTEQSTWKASQIIPNSTNIPYIWIWKGTRAIKQGLSLKNEKDNSFRDQQFGIGSTGQ